MIKQNHSLLEVRNAFFNHYKIMIKKSDSRRSSLTLTCDNPLDALYKASRKGTLRHKNELRLKKAH